MAKTAEAASAEQKVMRAIATRERRRAAAEKREAQKAQASASPIVPRSTASWSTKPPKSKAPTGAAAEVVGRVQANRADWASAHRRTARAERALRKDRVETMERWKHKNEGTPETHEHASRRNQGALVRLYQSGAIDAEQLQAAAEIAQVAERIGADVAVRTASLETRVDVTRMGDGSFFERLGQVRREIAYTRWRAEIRGPIGAVLEMLVGDPVGFTVIAKRYRMHNRRARQLLIDALDLWPRILSGVCKEVDHASLAAAHAGILA